MSERRNNRSTLERRLFVAGIAGAVALPLPLARARSTPAVTPAQTLGPFYPRRASERPRETDADLLRLDGDRVRTQGVPVYLTGRIADRHGSPVAGAAVKVTEVDDP